MLDKQQTKHIEELGMKIPRWIQRRWGWTPVMVIGLIFLGVVPYRAVTLQQSDTVGGVGARLRSIRRVPQNVTLWGAKATQRFLVLGKYADGLERDVGFPTRYSV